ncbi:MAG TPA: phosphatase PAP2 family protein [Anaerolineaceae bacterium]|nr:phosphatase PAP2 family protein [Anaerolineaceae bacterium]
MSDQKPDDPIHSIQDQVQSAVERDTVPHPVRGRRTRIFQAGLLAALIGFGFLTYIASTSAYTNFDVATTHFLQTFDFLPIELLMRAVSWPGFMPQAAILAGLTLLVLWVVGLHWETLVGAVSFAGVEALNLVIKTLVHRPRPDPNIVRVFKELTGFSFPSGHVMFYMGLFGFLAFLTYTLLKPSWRRTVLLVVFTTFLVLVGPSRVFLGEHWTSDVAAAYLAGGLWLALVIELYRRGKPWWKRRSGNPETQDQR